MARMAREGGMSGLQRAAILLITLGPERSAGIFKHLKEEEIEELTLEIANTRSVTPQVKEEVINDFYEVFEKTGATAALAASLFHFRELTVGEVKDYCRNKGVIVR